MTTEKYSVVLSLWNIDTFEGGIGSRGDFLANAINDEFSGEGIFVLSSAQTLDFAKESIAKGNIPDLISFGIGADFIAPYALELSGGGFSGGEINGSVYACPWCRGGYFLLSEKGVNEPISRLIVSKGENNGAEIAEASAGLEAQERVVLSPLAAYTEYLKGGSVMLGTQRDLWRLERRGVECVAEPIEEFCDLFQYIAVTTCDIKKREAAKRVAAFACAIGGEKLKGIGMFSANENPYGGELGKYILSETAYTLSPFTSREVLFSIEKRLSETKDKQDKTEFLKSCLKRLK